MAVLNSGIAPQPRPVTWRRRPGVLKSALSLLRTRIGLVLVVMLAGIAVFGPLAAPHAQSDFVGLPNTGPSPGVILGTDYLGQDVLSRFLEGGLEILVLSALATILGLAVGSSLGMLAAYAGGRPDDLIMRGMDVILAFPNILLVLVMIATLGPADWLVVVSVALGSMPTIARVTRGAAQQIIEHDFIAAAEALGVSRYRILTGEVLPNILSPLMVQASLGLTNSIGTIASLAFLGFTLTPDGANWGVMIQENELALVAQPWGVVLPLAAVALLTLGNGLIGDGIARAAAGIDRTRGAA